MTDIIINNRNYSTKYLMTETQAIITRAKNEGFTIPNDITIKAIDNYIRDMVNNGVWGINDIHFNFAYNNTNLLNFSRINWKLPFGTLISIQGSPTYTIQGWQGNDLDGYLDTDFINTVDKIYQNTNASIGSVVYKSQVGGTLTAGRICCSSTSDRITIVTSSATRTRMQTAGNLLQTVSWGGTGWKSISKTQQDFRDVVNKDVLTNVGANDGVGTGDPFGNKLVLLAAPSIGAYTNLGISNYMIGGAITNDQTQLMRNSYNKYLNIIGLPQIA